MSYTSRRAARQLFASATQMKNEGYSRAIVEGMLANKGVTEADARAIADKVYGR